jgi:hypothetical protein
VSGIAPRAPEGEVARRAPEDPVSDGDIVELAEQAEDAVEE